MHLNQVPSSSDKLCDTSLFCTLQLVDMVVIPTCNRREQSFSNRIVNWYPIKPTQAPTNSRIRSLNHDRKTVPELSSKGHSQVGAAGMQSPTALLCLPSWSQRSSLDKCIRPQSTEHSAQRQSLSSVKNTLPVELITGCTSHSKNKS